MPATPKKTPKSPARTQKKKQEAAAKADDDAKPASTSPPASPKGKKAGHDNTPINLAYFKRLLRITVPMLFIVGILRRVAVPVPIAGEVWLYEKLFEGSTHPYVLSQRAKQAAKREEYREESRWKTPLIFATSEGDKDKMNALIAEGHNVNERNEFGETPLHVAGIAGDASIVATLIDAGADVNARTKGGDSLKMTPTHWMVYGRHVDGLKALIVGGADVNLLNTEGKTPTDMVLEFMRAERKAAAKRAKETGEEATKENSHEPSTVEILNILAAAGGKTAKQMPDVKAPSKHDEL